MDALFVMHSKAWMMMALSRLVRARLSLAGAIAAMV